MSYYDFYGFRPYVSVATRRAKATREMDKLRKKGRVIAPVRVEGRAIARNFWGKAWCENLERYSDFANRLPRGRTYVRNGFVIDLQIERGRVRAMVSGSDIYEVRIDIAPVASRRWKAICADCSRSIGSLVELLQGKLSKNVMQRVCREGDGLFPAPREIKMSCTCPDWADMCKHVAATLYGTGVRFDAAPGLLFTLRGVDSTELIAGAGADLSMTQGGAANERILADDGVAALFDIEIAPAPVAPQIVEKKGNRPPQGQMSGHTAKAQIPRGKVTALKAIGRRARKKVKPNSVTQATDTPVTPRETRVDARELRTAAHPNAASPDRNAPPAATTSQELPSPPKISKGKRKNRSTPRRSHAKREIDRLRARNAGKR